MAEVLIEGLAHGVATGIPAEALGRRLLQIVVYDKMCRIGGTLTLDDLVETPEVGLEDA